jgi:ferredoxin
MKVRVDTDRCTGHSRCNAVAPDVYQLDDDGFCVIVNEDVPAEFERQAREGADVCPERAIEIDD